MLQAILFVDPPKTRELGRAVVVVSATIGFCRWLQSENVAVFSDKGKGVLLRAQDGTVVEFPSRLPWSPTVVLFQDPEGTAAPLVHGWELFPGGRFVETAELAAACAMREICE